MFFTATVPCALLATRTDEPEFAIEFRAPRRYVNANSTKEAQTMTPGAYQSMENFVHELFNLFQIPLISGMPKPLSRGV